MRKAYPDPSQDYDLIRLSLGERLLCAWETRKVSARMRRRGNSNVEVYPLRGEGIRPPGEVDLPLIFLTHNDRRFLPSFLKHYRGLGVTRFLVVDDASTDGTREMLLAQSDVDVFGSNVRYGAARRGRLWREALLKMHGAERWYLNVDSDEYLVYEDCERRPLHDLISALKEMGIERCPAPMIDAYPAGALAEAVLDGSTDEMPWRVASMFDADGYVLRKKKRALSLRGGMRERVFGAEVELMKYPLLFWREGSCLGTSIHEPVSYRSNFAPVFGVLLHFKFFSDTAEVAAEAVRDKQYFDGARAYEGILDRMTATGEFSFVSDNSISYSGSMDLVNRGFMAPVFS